MVKLYIKLINSVAEVISKDEAVNKKLKLVFIKNYGLTLAEKIIPAADISEQISTAGYEASGTGNMKFALNGAITAGTPDGANIEIGEHTGADNFYLFGLTNSEAESIRQNGYNPSEYYKENTELKEVIDLITSDHFNKKEPGIFSPITEDLLRKDFYLVLADFKAYCKMQKKIETDYTDRKSWTIKSILNTARSGYFSSDRTIREYAELVWGIQE
jgi:starch phosphorylase